MPEMEIFLTPEIILVLCFAAFLVGVVNTTFGVGGSLLVYPILLHWLPDKVIIGVLSVIVIMVTAHRILLFRRALSFKTLRLFLILGFPCALVGAYSLSRIPPDYLRAVVGVFLISMTIYDWLHDKNTGRSPPPNSPQPDPPRSFIIAGAFSGFLTGLIGSAGVINTAFLLRSGFTKEGISVNQAGIALAYSLIKFPVYWKYEIVSPAILLAGLIATVGSTSGTFLGSYLLRRLSLGKFTLLLRLVILLIGANLIFNWI
jgi:uncharacterized protein